MKDQVTDRFPTKGALVPAAITEDRSIRWGIIGAGGIADTVCRDINLTAGNVVVAVAARDAGRAAQFATRHGATRSYSSYESLVADPEVDVVYVATTHPNHEPHALLAIEAGKSVLIEKPVGLNAAQARRVFAAAGKADVFAMEAMWMRTNPLIRRAGELIADGAIGELRGVRMEFGLGIPFDPRHRLYDINNGGGALLDLGVYPASFAFHYLGAPDELLVYGELAPTGVDDTVAMEWLYAGVPRAQLWCSVSSAAPNEAAVFGTTGWITFAAPALRPSGLTVQSGGTNYRVADPIAGQGTGYGPEIEEVERCVRAGITESPLVPRADTIAILELLDQARAGLGVVYPGEAVQ
jgi:predicted dehydrogenase